MAPLIPFILEPSWSAALSDEWQKPYLLELAAFIEKEYALSLLPIYPPKDLIFNAFLQTPFAKVKVLIMGQDPYHGPGQAHGLCFSVPKGIKPPPSLLNIFKELQSDLPNFKSTHGCLMSWAKQGVMLLNATLTVRNGEPLSHHGKGWEKFTDAVIEKLAEREDPVIFVFWGKKSDKCHLIKESHHLILKAAHPSPLSAYNGFFGCRHFSKINEFLIKKGKEPINWQLED